MELLSPFQRAVAQAFFELPEARGFLLAGGGALLATGLTVRPTKDLDFFGTMNNTPLRDVIDRFTSTAKSRGWSVTEVQYSDDFARLVLKDEESLVVDFGIDSPPIAPSYLSEIGPTFAPEELAGRKLLALFDRAEARDFADIFALRSKIDKETLVSRARQLDNGFDIEVFSVVIRSVSRFDPEDFHPEESAFPAIVEHFHTWANDLSPQ